MTPEVVRIKVRAVPGSRTAGVVGRYGEAWKIRVTSAPEQGRANEELERHVAELLGLHRSDVRVIVGRSSRDKLLELSGAPDLATVEGVLDAASGK